MQHAISPYFQLQAFRPRQNRRYFQRILIRCQKDVHSQSLATNSLKFGNSYLDYGAAKTLMSDLIQRYADLYFNIQAPKLPFR